MLWQNQSNMRTCGSLALRPTKAVSGAAWGIPLPMVFLGSQTTQWHQHKRGESLLIITFWEITSINGKRFMKVNFRNRRFLIIQLKCRKPDPHTFHCARSDPSIFETPMVSTWFYINLICSHISFMLEANLNKVTDFNGFFSFTIHPGSNSPEWDLVLVHLQSWAWI